MEHIANKRKVGHCLYFKSVVKLEQNTHERNCKRWLQWSLLSICIVGCNDSSFTHCFLGNADESITATVPNAAVDATLLQQIHGWIEAGASEDDVINRLWLQAVPSGYVIHFWREGLCLIMYIVNFLWYRKTGNQTGEVEIYFGPVWIQTLSHVMGVKRCAI